MVKKYERLRLSLLSDMIDGGRWHDKSPDRGSKRIYGRSIPRSIRRSAAGTRRISSITIDDESINYYLPIVPFNSFCPLRYRFALHCESDETPLERFHSAQINHRFGIPCWDSLRR